MKIDETKNESSTNSSFNGAPRWYIYSREKHYKAGFETNGLGQWQQNFLGTVSDTKSVCYSTNDEEYSQDNYVWTATNGLAFGTNSWSGGYTNMNIYDPYGEIANMPDRDLYDFGWGWVPPQYMYHYYASNAHTNWVNSDGTKMDLRVTARTRMKIYTGGKAGVKQKSLFKITAGATEYGAPWPDAPNFINNLIVFAPWVNVATKPVDPTRIEVLGWWLWGYELSGGGDLYKVLPNGAEYNLNMHILNAKHYNATTTVTKYNLVHETAHQALTDTNWERLNLGVGEQVKIGFTPPFSWTVDWAASGGGLSDYAAS